MKKYSFSDLIRLLGAPVLTIVLGLILLFSPDSASALVSRIFGWLLILWGIGTGLSALQGQRSRQTALGIKSVALVLVGAWFLANPLALAKSLGFLLGIFLIIRGGKNLFTTLRQPRGIVLTPGLLVSVATAVIGLLLLLVPMATSRMLFSICGVVLICVGIAQAIDRLKEPKQLEAGDDPNIIDAL